jgi:hypothetical protein
MRHVRLKTAAVLQFKGVERLGLSEASTNPHHRTVCQLWLDYRIRIDQIVKVRESLQAGFHSDWTRRDPQITVGTQPRDTTSGRELAAAVPFACRFGG